MNSGGNSKVLWEESSSNLIASAIDLDGESFLKPSCVSSSNVKVNFFLGDICCVIEACRAGP